ncbi:hypothetical protein Tco_1359932 [Tanacetum coccineum]
MLSLKKKELSIKLLLSITPEQKSALSKDESTPLRFDRIQKRVETSVANDTSASFPNAKGVRLRQTRDPAHMTTNMFILRSYKSSITYSYVEPEKTLGASLIPAWLEAMRMNYLSFDKIHVWELVEQTVWQDQGLCQEEGIDFDESFVQLLAWRCQDFSSTNPPQDADHAGCLDISQRLLEEYSCVGDKLVSWMFKEQDCTAMSFAEAEYVALSASCAQVMWMRTQLQDYASPTQNYRCIVILRQP